MKLGEKDNCELCGKEFIRKHSQQRFCGIACQREFKRLEAIRKRKAEKPVDQPKFYWNRYERDAKTAPCGRYENCFVCEDEDCTFDDD